MWGDLLGALVNAGSSIWGGSQQRKKEEKFAKNSIQWRVADAKAAGIHPLAALGAQTQAPLAQPVMGDAVGAGVAKAFENKEGADLANDLLRSQIRNTDAQTDATIAQSRSLIADARRAGQSLSTRQLDPQRERLGFGGAGNARVDPRLSDAQTIQDRYGDVAESVYGILGALPGDMNHAFELRDTRKRQRRAMMALRGREHRLPRSRSWARAAEDYILGPYRAGSPRRR